MRRYDLKRFHHLYRHEYPFGGEVCAYCGDPATSEDHVVPLSYLGRLGTDFERRLPFLRQGLIIVPACHACNAMLGTFVATSVAARRRELARRLRRKYRRLLGAVEWSEEELSGLGPSLRIYFTALDARSRALWERYIFARADATVMRAMEEMLAFRR